MNLPNDLVSQFVKSTNDNTSSGGGNTTAFGTVVEYDGEMYVKIDGSDLLTPVDYSATIHDNDRVVVDIKNHTAVVSGNISSPSVSGVEIKQAENSLIVRFEEGLDNLLLVFKEGYYEGITTVNADGVKVSHTTYGGYAQMSYDGFFLNDGKKDVLSCTEDGLVYIGTIEGSTIKGGSIEGGDIEGTSIKGGDVEGTSIKGGTITGTKISGGTISIGGNFSVDGEGNLQTDSCIHAVGGIYTYQDIRGMNDDETSGGLTIVSGKGHVALRTEDSDHSVYLQSASGEVKVTRPSDGSTYINLRADNLIANTAVYANGVNVTSDKKKKKNIENYGVDALAEICTTPVYTYHLETDLDEERKRIGLIMQESPVDVVDLRGGGIDLYHMITMVWRAIQQINDKVNIVKVDKKDKK